MECLPACRSLRALDLSRNGLDESGASTVCDALPRCALRSLHLVGMNLRAAAQDRLARAAPHAVTIHFA